MSNINQDRLQQLQQFFDNQTVTVEVLPVTIMTNKGQVIHRFNGTRGNYNFKDGICKNVKKSDLHYFENQPQFVIHSK
jgi:CO dehydrogenase/acetyl-CoA synthase beta subunit